jgi:hypothetical protein
VSRYLSVRQRLERDPALHERMRNLAAFQARRLADTYRDLQGTPRHGPAVEFFLTDLYGPQDLTERDAQILRALDKLKRFLPPGALQALARAFELHVLSIELDAATAAALPGPDRIDAATYAGAYRAAGRRADRERQIALIGDIGSLLDGLAHRPEVGLAVRLARAPAHAAGYGQLQDFLERGFHAFRKMNGAAEFLAAIGQRERALMERLFGAGG